MADREPDGLAGGPEQTPPSRLAGATHSPPLLLVEVEDEPRPPVAAISLLFLVAAHGGEISGAGGVSTRPRHFRVWRLRLPGAAAATSGVPYTTSGRGNKSPSPSPAF